jgi:hypothetical protein
MEKNASGVNQLLRRVGKLQKPNLRHFLTVSIVAFLVTLAIPNFFYVATEEIHPWVSPQDLRSIETLQGKFPDDTLLYAPQGINYFVTSRTGYEAPPARDYNDWPVRCARKMYYDVQIKGRPSYYIITSNQSPFVQNSLNNQYAKIEGLTNFHLIRDELKLTITTTNWTDHIYCSIRHVDHTKVDLSHPLMPSKRKVWNASLTLDGLDDGLYMVYITPETLSDPNPNSQQCWFIFYVYHFSTLPEQQIPLDDLVYEVEGSHNIHVMGVNTTTAQRINLLQLNLFTPPAENEQIQPEPILIAMTPFYFIPYKQFFFSNFILILLLCPLNTIYLLALIRFAGGIFKRLSIVLEKISQIQNRTLNPRNVVPNKLGFPGQQGLII